MVSGIVTCPPSPSALNSRFASASLGAVSDRAKRWNFAAHAQCPSDAPHLAGFYSRYFKEHGRFPVLEKHLD